MHSPRLTTLRATTVASTSVLALAMAGCSSPQTAYTDANGEQVTVSWEDYPGEAGQDAEKVRRAPTQAKTEALSADLLADVEAAVDAEYDLDWHSRAEADGPGWFRTEGNGYGGESAYIGYNSAQRQATDIPTDPADWDRIVQIVDQTVQQHGFEPLVLHETYPGERQQSAETYGTDDPDQWPHWNTITTGDVGWLSFSLTDRNRHPSTADEDGMGWPDQSIDLMYGVTTIADDERATFDQRIAPYEGLELPEATHSD